MNITAQAKPLDVGKWLNKYQPERKRPGDTLGNMDY